MNRWILAVALAFGSGSATAAAGESQAWVARSNELAKVLLDAQAKFLPERLSFFGVPGYDTQVADFGPDNGPRYRKALADAKTELERLAAAEKDANVRQDLAIMIDSAQRAIDASRIGEQHLLPFVDVPQVVWFGLNPLLRDDTPPARRAAAKARLERYVGLAPGSTSVFDALAQRYAEAARDPKRLPPVRNEVEQALQNAQTYVDGLRQLFAKHGIEAKTALDALDAEVKQFVAWAKQTVLPKARTDFRLPPEVYAQSLRDIGIDIDPKVLIQRAQLEFMETRSAMQALAPLVAKERGIEATDYREVIRALKKNQFAPEAIEGEFRKVITALERKIDEHDVVDLPKRPMAMRVASAAETAAQPAPNMQPPPMVGNTGQQGTFVLPLGNPATGAEHYDDFTYDAASWTLTAHEGRPGHELQFTAMVERGVSLARSLFAFNSVNVEGWALYAEAEMVPYEPIEGQLIALQYRLMRAARAMLDPMLNLGMIDRERAGKVLSEEVVLSKPMVQQELDRYTFNMPGQAGAYFYGYARLLELRAETELALGDAFDRLAFNNFLLDQGLLPPDLLAKAVREEFIPAQRAKAKD